MGFDKNDATDQRRAGAARAAETVEARRQTQINTLYRNLRSPDYAPFGTTSSTVAGASSSHSVATQQTPSVIIPESERLTAKQTQACREYFDASLNDAESAIANCNIIALRHILGPNLYHSRQVLVRQSRENLWQWLRLQCQRIVLQAQGRGLVRFARSNQYPKELANSHYQNLREAIKASFDMAVDGIEATVTSWTLEDKLLRVTVVTKLRNDFNRALNELNTAAFTNLPEVMYELWTECETLKRKMAICQQKSTTLSSNYTGLIDSAHVRQIWQQFSDNMNARVLLESIDDFSALRNCRLAEFALSDIYFDESLEKQASVLLDKAIDRYQVAAPDEKVKLLPLIEFLLQHGDRPSASLMNRLEQTQWSLLELIFKYTDAPTDYSESVRRQLLDYCERRSEQRNLIVRGCQRLVTSQSILAERQTDIRSYLRIMLGENIETLDTALSSDIAFRSERARTLVWSPRLYIELSVSSQMYQTGKLVSGHRSIGSSVEVAPKQLEGVESEFSDDRTDLFQL